MQSKAPISRADAINLNDELADLLLDALSNIDPESEEADLIVDRHLNRTLQKIRSDFSGNIAVLRKKTNKVDVIRVEDVLWDDDLGVIKFLTLHNMIPQSFASWDLA